jgi:hypothetical protein
MDSQDLRNLSEAYNSVYETIGTAKPQSQYSTKPGDGKPYKDGPLWGGPDDKPTPTAPKPATPTASTSLKPRNDVRNRNVSARGGFDPRFDRRPKPTTGGTVKTPTPTTTTAPKPNVGGVLGQLDKMARRTAGDIGSRIGEREGRNRTGNIPVISDIGGAIGRNKGREQGQKTYDNLKNTATQALGGLLKQDYEYDIDEMTMNPNSRFTTAAQRKEYSANQIGSKEFSDRGGYAALKAGGGQAALKKGSSVSDVLYAGKKAVATKAKQDFANKLNRPSAPAPVKKPMDDFAAGGGAAKMKATGMTKDQVIAQGKKNLANSYEPDNFDIILEYLVAEGYADTNENALVIMANMSEEWKETILEAEVLAQKGGVPGSVKVRPSISIPGTNIGVGPNKPVPGTFTTTTPGQREKIKQGDTQIDTGVGGMKPREGAGPTSSERQRYNRQAIRTGARPMAQ